MIQVEACSLQTLTKLSILEFTGSMLFEPFSFIIDNELNEGLLIEIKLYSIWNLPF